MSGDMKIIRTVRGDIEPSEIGFTSMHEHTLADMTPIKTNHKI
jgi:predicted metal-dependent phosphotriesterase family hydrolase